MWMTATTQRIAAARARIETLTPTGVAVELVVGDVLLFDLREAEEWRQQGGISGSIHAPCGMLEFYANPTSAYYAPEFNPGRRTILYCAAGGRSALAADLLQILGYTRVAYLEGGLKAWQDAGLPLCSATAA